MYVCLLRLFNYFEICILILTVQYDFYVYIFFYDSLYVIVTIGKLTFYVKPHIYMQSTRLHVVVRLYSTELTYIFDYEKNNSTLTLYFSTHLSFSPGFSLPLLSISLYLLHSLSHCFCIFL